MRSHPLVRIKGRIHLETLIVVLTQIIKGSMKQADSRLDEQPDAEGVAIKEIQYIDGCGCAADL